MIHLIQEILNDNYFSVISYNENRCDIVSNNTGHLWSIQYHHNRPHPVCLMHRRPEESYYHTQWRGFDINKPVQIIKDHDAWITELYSLFSSDKNQ